jgi:hypothetical protein
MQKFEVYKGKVQYSDTTGSKIRPSIVIGISVNQSVVFVLGVYSYRKWFNKDTSQKEFLEIFDYEEAGLREGSFVELKNVYDIPKFSFEEFEFLGRLSERDAKRIVLETFRMQ